MKISAGWISACITDSKELYLWNGAENPVKTLTITESVVDVSVGRYVASATDSRGMVWTWGKNDQGELGLGDFDVRAHPAPMLALKSRKLKKVSCGGNFAIGLGQNVRIKSATPKQSQRETSIKTPAGFIDLPL